jgi:hypothetical protein
VSTEFASALLAYLSAPEAAPAEADIAPGPGIDAGPIREAAAVLAAIRRPEALVPVGGGAPVDVRSVLGAELVPVTGSRFNGVVMLDPDVRRRMLADLVQRSAVKAALDANPDERQGPVQAQLEAYLLGSAPSIDDQTLEQLDATLQVAVWLGDVVEDLPAPAAIQARAAYRRLLQPFEALAGDGVFEGRRRELDTLRSYVGVVPPADLLRRIQTKAFTWLSGPARPALTIHGPGGVGKSALVARFMLEHTRVPEAARIPFAYLDFDRPTLDIGDVRGLVLEMLKQLLTQVSVPALESIQAAAAHRGVTEERVRSEDVGFAESLLADMLGAMGTALGDRPFLVVLDTFEEVQYRGEARAYPLWDMLGRLQQRWPVLRVVIAGRAPVSNVRLAGEPPIDVPLGDLDDRAAIAFLRNVGVKDAQLAKRVVRTVGGVPLSLKLVASLLAQDATAADVLGGLGRGGRAGDAQIQGMLYERVLGHIHDERVRRLAYPGLVLRRITPDVLLEVLNDPCELGLTGPADALALFESLAREVSLMTLDPVDGSLVHRSDVRRIMLGMLMAEDPQRVEAIRRAAIAYYDAQPGQRGMAEAAYHRLFLHEPVDEAVLLAPEVRTSLQASIVDLPDDPQVLLATHGYKVDKGVLESASRADREQSIAAEVERLLPNGPSAVGAAASTLPPDADIQGASPLHRAAARVALQLGDDARAARLIDRGLAEAGLANAPRVGLDLLIERAWLEVLTQEQASEATLADLETAATREGDVRARLIRYLLAPVPGSGPERQRALDIVTSLLRRMDPAQAWFLAPALRRPLSAALRDGSLGLVEVIREMVLDEGSPYRYTSFPDPSLARALDAALDPNADPKAFGWAFMGVLEQWPYRVLAVEPPESRRVNLFESAS